MTGETTAEARPSGGTPQAPREAPAPREARAARRTPTVVRALLWPAMAAWCAALAVAAPEAGLSPALAQSVVLVAAWISCAATERLAPASDAWTPSSIGRASDVAFGAMTLLVESAAAVATAALLLRLRADGAPGPIASLHPAAATALLLVAYEFIQYGIHRGCHELRGPAGRFLWRLHSVHHRPEALNARMSLVAHPLETIVIRTAAVCAPVLLLGPDVVAAYAFLTVVNVQTVLVHWNADVALGPLRHLVVGPALHRIHHGAGRDDGRNYAALLAPVDRLFGTWHEKGGAPPDRIGIRNDRRYPAPTDIAALLRWPFSSRRRRVATAARQPSPGTPIDVM